MINSYLKTTFRNLRREKLYALINVLGLLVAIASALVVGLYVHTQLSYDRHLNNQHKLYRASLDLINGDSLTTFSLMSEFMAPAMAQQNPLIEDYVRLQTQANPSLLHIQGQPSYGENIYKADDNIFAVFGHPVIYGDPLTALVDPSSAAISESFNQLHFAGADSTGETITVNGQDYFVTLIYEDLPDNSHLKYDLLLSINDISFADAQLPNGLFSVNSYTYLLMAENTDVKEFAEFFDEFWANNTAEVLADSGITSAMTITPISEVHFGPEIAFDQPTGNKFVIYSFAIVGVLILLVACVNYVNLATARSVRRAKEVGMRKILGASRRSLILQFLFEAVFFSLLAVLLAIALVELILQTAAGDLIAPQLSISYFSNPLLLLSLLGGGLVLGLVSGAYPALHLSSLLPANLDKSTAVNKSNSKLRSVMVIIQFAITISVIASSLLIYAQMAFIQNSPLGFNAKNKVVLHLQGLEYIPRVPLLINSLESYPLFKGATFTAYTPATGFESGNWSVENNNGELEFRFLSFQQVDYNYLTVMDMELVAGRDFNEADDRSHVIVNQALVRQMGWENPIGKRTGLPGDGSEIVIGVVADFHFSGLQSEISPLILRPSMAESFGERNPELSLFQNAKLTVALDSDSVGQAITVLEDTWQQIIPELPFEYELLEEVIKQQYASENNVMAVITYFAAVCIFISCLGLLGLSAYSTQQRTKEIGIRKVLGANMSQIMANLFKSIFFLVCIGSVLASLISYYTINSWLQNFAYTEDINLMVFPVSAAIAMLLAFATMAMQSYKTVRTNPIEALRYE